MTTYEASYFTKRQKSARASARRVVPMVLELVGPRSVIDIGCGLGEWLSVFVESGVEDVQGIDGGDPAPDRLLISPTRFLHHDLRRPPPIDRTFDLAVCLEVAEHLPEECAPALVHSLTSLAPVVLFSAAIPGQGGTGHVNEQWPEYWAERFRERGYSAVDGLRWRIWNDPEVGRWYRNNILIFATDRAIAAHPLLERERRRMEGLPLRLVHPDVYLRRAQPTTRRLVRMLRRKVAADLRAAVGRWFGRR